MKCFEVIALATAILVCCTALPAVEGDNNDQYKIDSLTKEIEGKTQELARLDKEIENLTAENQLKREKATKFEGQFKAIVNKFKDITTKMYTIKNSNKEIFGLTKEILKLTDEIGGKQTTISEAFEPLRVYYEYDKNYYISDNPAPYITAKSECKAHGMEIVTFDSEDEASNVHDALGERDVVAYVGMERSETFFKNTHGKRVKIQWASGEPNNAEGVEDCVAPISSFYGYNDLPCDKKLRFVCQQVKKA